VSVRVMGSTGPGGVLGAKKERTESKQEPVSKDGVRMVKGGEPNSRSLSKKGYTYNRHGQIEKQVTRHGGISSTRKR